MKKPLEPLSYSCFQNIEEMQKSIIKDPGYIYIATNKSLCKYYIKIGLTRDDPKNRIRQLSNQTAIPMPFSLKCFFEVDNCKEYEKNIHILLREYRISKNKEFFEIPWFIAKELVVEKMKFYTSFKGWVKNKKQNYLITQIEKLNFDFN